MALFGRIDSIARLNALFVVDLCLDKPQSSPSNRGHEAGAARLLRRAAAFWFVAAVAGQWTFVTYIAMFYGPTLLSGDFQKGAGIRC